MHALATRQAIFLPLGAMLALIAFAFTVPGYHSLSQHLSELGLLPGLPAQAVLLGPSISGCSIIIFSLSLLVQARRFALTAVTSTLFGAAMLSNGLVTTGSPMHGLYGVGIFSVLTPLLFLVELGPQASSRIRWVSCWTSLLGMAYLWMMVTGMDPPDYRGLTQRLALLPAFGWYAFAAIERLKIMPAR
ncbi:DUF998 domain-containing protein [Stenotrophomonas sp. 24(2023)]|uniref:DUF998 domain-containing protein n=1 Tax=Stenotrophomonas sp. 24(2023) TaxID=3068324 RepID=UPI0027E1241D|nr:DUF998 domain-containing protein [Stenotrophomonas sp. 24(2023)]WMJ70628.1 DUF998 domain-containing protein [Stenotrophomonas sp. 24(2023)]